MSGKWELFYEQKEQQMNEDEPDHQRYRSIIG